MRDAMTVRERFRAAMSFEPFDRLPVFEWAAWWDKTMDRWRAEGLVFSDRDDLSGCLGLDRHFQLWFGSRGPDCPKPAEHGKPIISGMDDYQKIKQFLFPAPAPDGERLALLKRESAAGRAAVWMTLDGFFWAPRVLLGIEEHLYAFYDKPDLLRAICGDLADWHLRVIRELSKSIVPDFMTFAEDMSYNNGPMISKELFDEFIRPYYTRVVPELRALVIKVIIDSDGDIEKLADWYDGVADGFLPLERQAGTDIYSLRAKHPRQIYIGAFDKMTMSKGEGAMRAEFERLLPVARKGGFLISCDHQTPPEVSLEDYRVYLRLFREYAAAAGLTCRCRAETSPRSRPR